MGGTFRRPTGLDGPEMMLWGAGVRLPRAGAQAVTQFWSATLRSPLQGVAGEQLDQHLRRRTHPEVCVQLPRVLPAGPHWRSRLPVVLEGCEVWTRQVKALDTHRGAPRHQQPWPFHARHPQLALFEQRPRHPVLEVIRLVLLPPLGFQRAAVTRFFETLGELVGVGVQHVECQHRPKLPCGMVVQLLAPLAP